MLTNYMHLSHIYETTSNVEVFSIWANMGQRAADCRLLA